MADAIFHVPTAFCQHCQFTIEQAVGNLSGVASTAIDLPSQTVSVRYDEALLTAEAIRQRIEGAGFPVPVP